MSIELRVVRHAQALSEHGSFSRAAEALGIAQPTLSRSIKELEDALGMQLFSRHRFGVEPTDFGHLFLQQAAMVVAQVADLEREIALAKGLQKGELSVGFGPYAAEVLAPGCLRHFASAHPSVGLRIQVDTLETLGRVLRGRTADLIVGEATTLEDDDAIEIIARLPSIRAYIVARAGHPLASQPVVSIHDALRFPFVQVARLPPRVLKPILSSRQSPKDGGAFPALPFPAIECPSVPLAISAIAASDAVMLASLGMVRREMERRQVVPILHEPWMRSDWAIMRLRKRTLGPAAMAFAHELQRVHDNALAEDAVLTERWAATVGRSTKVRPTTNKGSRRRSSAA
jgi:DNA-binding transcriptional LysR family regulator